MLAREIRQRIGEQALLKADRSPVTVADFAVQATVAHRLHQVFPDDRLVAEEDAASLRAADARTILQSVVDALHPAAHVLASNLDSNQVLDAIDRAVRQTKAFT